MKSYEKVKIGQVYHYLTVVGLPYKSQEKHNHWVTDCLCKCGKTVSIQTANLVNGRAKSCPCRMSQIRDLTGQQFGKWTVLCMDPEWKPKKDVKWEVKCECGYTQLIHSRQLTHKGSSGCTKCVGRPKGSASKNFKGHGELSLTKWTQIKTGAASRGHKVNISIEDAWNLFEKQKRICALSGRSLEMDTTVKKGTASLDRIDSSRDYEEGNVQWVHKTINIMKNTLDQDEFISFCRDVGDKCELK